MVRLKTNGPAEGGAFAARVLVVDDSAIQRQGLTLLLEMAGHLVQTAATVAEGRAKLNGQTHILLDLVLPDGRGTELLGEIRQRCRSARVAIVSGEPPEVLAEAQRLGPDRIFPKPVDVTALLDWIGC